MRKILTKERAIDLSIKKWEAIIANGGNNLTKGDAINLGIWNFSGTCGLCEKYKDYEKNDNQCFKCPFNCNLQYGCSNLSHVWFKWYSERNKETAQAVLDALVELKH